MRLIPIVLLCITATSAVAGTRATIAVRPDAEVASPKALFSDVATVTSDDKALAKKILAADICPTPSPGGTRKVDKDYIVIALRRAGVNDREVDLLCPNEVTIKRSCTTISGEAILEKAREFVAAAPWTGTIEVQATRLPAAISAPAGSVTIDIRSGSKSLTKGHNNLYADISVDKKPYRTVSVPVLVRLTSSVLVALHPIARGEAITPENTACRQADVTTLPDDILSGMPETGCVASIPMAQGAVIRTGWIAEPPVVKATDPVIVVVEGDSIRITDKGVAMQSGRVGETVKVRLLGDNREVRGKVTEPGVVSISI